MEMNILFFRNNVHHRRSIAACLVQGVYVLERDRQVNRQGPEALAPPWWEFFHFDLIRQLQDDVDYSIFGAIFEFKPPPSTANNQLTHGTPRYVIAFRGTITKGEAFSQDFKLDLHFIKNGLHETSRFEIGMQAVRNIVAAVGPSNIWLAGHSLGSAIAMLAGKNMAKTGILLEAFLFNPPYFSAPIERIKDKKVKHGIRIAGSLLTAGLAMAMKGHHQRSPLENQFFALSPWVPCLFVHPADHICSEYIGYFEHRQRMEDMGAGGIERLSTQNSLSGLFMNAIGRESEPLHILPSANLTVNLCRYPDFKRAHGLHQWWSSNLHLQSKLYQYK
ncbi:hypothetical protein GIB67_038359 [Kingdonia uniflora]|uniref:Fungal lipase-type domain-containing protein n=1 Tax=Kingdonia uniflora TaxID=39325 RepID=A0A7J7M2P9_9MAGN|nr:hypothetical protein GIB67_001564 [Kingdonia uniflora]KAF6149126.1 hypothetical protein GIB67_038359 [Kingdonia uniflora]